MTSPDNENNNERASAQQEALSALDRLSEEDKIKVLEYIQELVNFAKHEN